MICRNCSKLIRKCTHGRSGGCALLGYVHNVTRSHFCDINNPQSMLGRNLATPDPEFHTEEEHDTSRSG